MKPSAKILTGRTSGLSVWRLVALVSTAVWSAPALNVAAPGMAATPSAGAVQLPFQFEANRGQTAPTYQFLANGRGCTYLLSPNQAIVSLAKPSSRPAREGIARRAVSGETTVRSLRFQLAGANAAVQGEGLEPLAGRVNYLLGNDPAAWQTDVPTFSKVRFSEVYPGVALVYYGCDRQLEFDFIVAPGADPAAIAFEIAGADKLALDEDGDLLLHVGEVVLRQHRPVSFQTVAGRRQPVASSYRLVADQRVELQLGSYDRSLPLVIDPVFDYATYFGGSGLEAAWDLAVDAGGAVYLAGETTTARLARVGGYQTNYAGGNDVGGDAFVAKFGPAGTNLIYMTYLGGAVHDGVLALALDAGGNAYLTGFTGSSDYPTVGPLKTNINGAPYKNMKEYPIDGFITKLNSNGTALVYSAFLGGSGVDEGIGVSVDAAGRAYVAGFTESTNLPTTAGALQAAFGGVQDGFVTCINAAGTGFDYFSYLGGKNADYVDDVAADADGYAYLTGYTSSTNFPTTNAIQFEISNPTNAVRTNVYVTADAFVTKLTPGGQLVYSSFLGGADTDVGFRIAPDSAGSAYVVGLTYSPDFPVSTTNLTGTGWTNRAYSEVFVTKVGAAGATNWTYSVTFGGTGYEEGWDVRPDAAGNAHVVGFTGSRNFPVLNVPSGGATTNRGLTDGFVTSVNADGTALNYSLYFGGSGNDQAHAVALDPAGNLYFAGTTDSANLPVKNAFQSAFAGGEADAFVGKLLVAPALSIVSKAGAVQVQWRAPAGQFVLESRSGETETSWTPVTARPVVADGYHVVTLDSAPGAATQFRLRLP